MQSAHPDRYVLNSAQARETFAVVRSIEQAASRWGLDPDPVKLMRAGHIELTFVTHDPHTGLLLRARPDSILFEQRLIIDLKSCHDASPEAFSRDALRMGYGLRAAAYIDAIARCLDEDPSAWAFMWVCVEKSEPYPMAQYSASGDLLAHGQREYRKALDLVASCEATGTWPGYATSIQPLDLPEYLKRELTRAS